MAKNCSRDKKVFLNFKPFGINALKDIKTINGGSDYAHWFGFNKNNVTIPILNQKYINYLKLQENGAWKEVDGKIKNNAFDGAKTINESGKLKIMIISDSQGKSLSPYLTSSFNKLNMFHYSNINIFNPQMFEAEIKNYSPDIILYIMTGRALIDLT